MEPTVPGLIEWARAFERQAKEEKNQDTFCLIKSFSAEERNPFQFVQRRSFLKKLLLRVIQTVKLFFGSKTYDLDFQVKSFLEEAKREVPLIRTYLKGITEGERKKLFSSVDMLFYYLERCEINTKKRAVLNDLYAEEQNISRLFSEPIVEIAEEVGRLLEGATISISPQGSVVYNTTGGEKKTAEDLFQAHPETSTDFRREVLGLAHAQFLGNPGMQKDLAEAMITCYETMCGDAERKVREALKKCQGGWIWVPTATTAAVDEVSLVVKALEAAYAALVGRVGSFAVEGGEGLFTEKTLTTVSSAIKGKYEKTWDILRKEQSPIVQAALCKNTLEQMDALVDTLHQGLEGVTPGKASPEQKARIGRIVILVEEVRKTAAGIHEGAKNATGVWEGIATRAEKLVQTCDETMLQVKEISEEKGKEEREGGITIIYNAPVTINAASGAVVNAGVIIGNISLQPYVKAAKKADNAFQAQNKGVLEGIAKKALTASVAGAVKGLVFGGVPGLVTMGIASAVASLANSIVTEVGGRVGLSPTMATVFGFMTSLATSWYSRQYINSYLRGPSAKAPSPAISQEPVVPQGISAANVTAAAPVLPQGASVNATVVEQPGVAAEAQPQEISFWGRIWQDFHAGDAAVRRYDAIVDKVGVVAPLIGAGAAAMLLGGPSILGKGATLLAGLGMPLSPAGGVQVGQLVPGV